MRVVAASLALAILTGCTPPPKVAGHSQTAGHSLAPARPAPTAGAPTAPAPPPQTKPTASPSASPAKPTEQHPTLVQPPAPRATGDQRTLGQPGGFALEAASTIGSWTAYCQPIQSGAPASRDMQLDERNGPRSPVRLTLDVGSAAHEIEELLAIDPEGRFLVTLEDGVPMLRDATLGGAFSLASLAIDLSRDALPDHRSVAFSTDGTELALLTQLPGAAMELTLLDLAAADPSLAVRKVALNGTRVWRVSAEGDSFVLTSATPSAKSANWPVRPWSEPNLRCTQGTFDAFSRISGPLRDPTLSHALLPRGVASAKTAKLTPQPAPGFVMAFGSAWVRREDSGRLLLVEGKQQRQLASARCGGRIFAADARSGWFLVACEGYRPVKREEPKPSSKKRPPPPKVRFPLYLLKPGVVRDLDLELMRVGVDVPPEPRQRFVAVRAETGLLLVDLRQGKAELLPSADRLLLATEADVLLASGGRLVRWADGKREELGRIGQLDPVATGTGALAVGATLYVQRTHTGKAPTWEAMALPRPPVALTPGFALVPAKEATVHRWAAGPVEAVPLGAAEKPTEEEADAGKGLVAGR